jgi:crossover junction endodeoxyribonuclease RuvC
MRVLGIDPGTSLIGFGIIDADGKSFRAVDFGSLKTGVNIRNSERVKTVHDFFDKLIKKFKPDKVAIESLFFFKNAKTAIEVSEIRGVLMFTAVKNGVKIAEFTPLQIKQAVSGYGRAEKNQVQKMVKLILGLKTEPNPDDVADALALAICCANTADLSTSIK